MTTSRFAGTFVRFGTDPRVQTVDLGPPPDPPKDRGCPVVLTPGALAWLLWGTPAIREERWVLVGRAAT